MAFRSASADSGASNTVAGTLPAGTQAGDTLVYFVSIDHGTATVTFPAGFVKVTGSPVTSSAEAGRFECAVKANATGSDNVTASCTTSNDHSWLILCFSGRDTANPITAVQATAGSTPQTTSINVALGGVTAATGDDIAWVAGLDPLSSSSTQGLTTPPTNYTERADTTGGDWASAFAATRDNVSAGATGTLTGVATINSGNEAGFGGFVIALKAAGGGGPAGRRVRRGIQVGGVLGNGGIYAQAA